MSRETRAYFGCVTGMAGVIALTLLAVSFKNELERSPMLQAWVRAVSPFDEPSPR